MFFDMQLLVRRGGGKLTTVWLVATRGVKKVSRKQIEDVNVPVVCDEVLEMVMSDSNRPRHRFSLSLSARLLSGIVRVHLEQVKHLQGDLYELYRQIQRPLALQEQEERKHVPKVKPKKRVKPITSQEVEVVFGPSPEILEHPITDEQLAAALLQVPTARVDEITLREELPMRPTVDDSSFADEGTSLVPLEVVERLMRGDQLEPPIQEVAHLPPADRSVQPPVEAPSLHTLEITEPHPREELPLLSQLETAAPPEKERSQKRARESPTLSDRPEKRLRASLESPVPLDAALMPPPQPKKKGKTINNICAPGRESRITRKRYSKHQEEIFNVTMQPLVFAPIGTATFVEDPDIRHLATELGFNQHAEEGILSAADSKARASESKIATPKRSIPSIRGSTPARSADINRRTMDSISLEVTAPTAGATPTIVEVPPGTLEPEQPTFQQPSVIEQEISIQETPRVQYPPEPRALVMETEQRAPNAEQMDATKRLDTHARLMIMMKKIKEWDFDAKQLTIKDLAQKPLNKRNILEAFYDLGVLAMKQYVCLVTEEDSILLKNIEKGYKFDELLSISF